MDERQALEQTLESPRGGAAHPALSGAIQEQLGRELREMYADIQREPLTDRLADLVRQLERKTPTILRL
jgi:Anti-sigma factor NepR